MNIKYEKSAVYAVDFPKDSKPEIALVGRSNAGKSSFLNALGVQSVAHVSKSPGKTRLINFFTVGNNYRIVDMPGYGFARRPQDEVKSWKEMIEGYLLKRENLVGVLIIIDARREWQEDESILANTFDKRSLAWAQVLTKADQLTNRELKARVLLGETLSKCFVVSNLKKIGHDEVEEFIFTQWVKPKLAKPAK